MCVCSRKCSGPLSSTEPAVRRSCCVLLAAAFLMCVSRDPTLPAAFTGCCWRRQPLLINKLCLLGSLLTLCTGSCSACLFKI